MRRSATLLLCVLLFATGAAARLAAYNIPHLQPTRVISGDYLDVPFIDDLGNIATTISTEPGEAPVIISPDGSQRTLPVPETEYVTIISFCSSGKLLAELDSSVMIWDAAGNSSQIDLGTAGEDEYWYGNAMNNNGYIAGAHSYYHSTLDDYGDVASYYYTSTPWLWRPDGSKMQMQGVSGFDMSESQDINDAGWMVGIAYSQVWPDEWTPSHYQAVLWSPDGQIRHLRLDRGNSYAVAISNTGEIAGGTELGPAVWDTKGKLRRRLQWPEWATRCYVKDINDKGTVVGYAYSETLESSVPQAVAWDQRGRLIELEPLPGDDQSYAFHINNANQVVGWSSQSSFFDPSEDSTLVVWTVH